MFVIYALNDKKAISYTSEYAEQLEGYAIAETSIVDDLEVFDCYIRQVEYDEIKKYDVVAAIESYRK